MQFKTKSTIFVMINSQKVPYTDTKFVIREFPEVSFKRAGTYRFVTTPVAF